MKAPKRIAATTILFGLISLVVAAWSVPEKATTIAATIVTTTKKDGTIVLIAMSIATEH